MAEYKCERCQETNPHGVSLGMCSPCLGELAALKPGDRVEWLHTHSGNWRPATFKELCRGRFTAALTTPVGCVVYRRQAHIRVPGGRLVPNSS